MFIAFSFFDFFQRLWKFMIMVNGLWVYVNDNQVMSKTVLIKKLFVL